MLNNINPKKLRQGRVRRMCIEIYYEELFEKSGNYDKVLNGFQSMVAGFTRSRSMLNEGAEDSIYDIQRQLKQLHSEEDVQELWNTIESFFGENLETDVEEALSDTDYPEGVA